jgi:ArsR family transcriptional regulator
MEELLIALRALAEPTRLRLLALAARGGFCVVDFTEILGQSQPRLSRHLKLLCDAGLLARLREGANVWFTLPDGEKGNLVHSLLDRLPESDPPLAADRRQAARVLAERARTASASFAADPLAWDEMRTIHLPAEAAESTLLSLLPHPPGRLLDIGTGTGGLLARAAPQIKSGLGIDASRTMLSLARTRLADAGFGHCSVRLADMYRLPLADASFDAATLCMVLHHAEDPTAVLAEAARVLRPGGALLIAELDHYTDPILIAPLSHRWPGFSPDQIAALLTAAGFTPDPLIRLSSPIDVLIWRALKAP